MIFWKDFILDDIVGPILAMPEERPTTSGRDETRFGSPDTRNGASGNNTVLSTDIQETRQEQRPARMVGHSSHDSAQVDRKSAESNRTESTRLVRGGGESFPLTPTSANALTAPTTPDRRLPVVDKSQVDPETLKAAQGMEAMFIDYMLKVMRETVPKQDMDLESPATGIYRGMQDSEFAQKAAQAGGVGLADQIVAYLESQRYTLPRGQGVPAGARTADAVSKDQSSVSTGGTHEGRPIHK